MKRNLLISCTVIISLLSILFVGCSNKNEVVDVMKKESLSIDPHGVYYEIFVRSFADSNNDGIGDLKGATNKLDYLADLGIEGIWLMPINPSPSYHGYDVTDYKDIHPEYGSLDDMKTFVEKAHEKGIKVIIDFVINHSSKEHPWFQKALTGDLTYRDYYVWANDDTNTNSLGEWGQKVWHGAGNNTYEGIFWEGMPDLNLDNPNVRKEIIDIGKYWLEDIGIDGFRLDAAKHIYSQTSSQSPEEKNHQWWQEFRAAMEEVKKDVVLVGEVWDTTTVVAPYLNDGLTSAFNFDLAEKILESAKSERDAGIVTSLTRTRKYFDDISKGKYIDSTFITNHDMPRVMTELNGNIDQAKMAASLLLTLPGNPYIYYGEETGLFGPKPDEDIREPFIWKNDKNASEQTKWQANKHNPKYDEKSVEAQLENENSILNHYKKLIHVRRSHNALIKGEIESALTKQAGALIFKRTSEEGSLLIIHNLSSEEISFPLSEKENSFIDIYFKSKNEASINEKSKQVSIPAYSTMILGAKQK